MMTHLCKSGCFRSGRELGELGIDRNKNEYEDLSVCMESALYVMSQDCIRMVVFREGEYSVNQVPIKVFNVLFDTGALQRSYINKIFCF